MIPGMGDWISVTGAVLGAAFLFILVGVLVKIRGWLIQKVSRHFMKAVTLTKASVQMSREVDKHLQLLRARFDAARVAVFQFHNGEVFMLADHSWKTSCTHEVVAEGVTHTFRENQNLLVSQIVDWLDPIITGDTTRTQGCDIATVCHGRQATCPMADRGHKVFLYRVDEMVPSVSKYLALKQGVGAVYCTPLKTPEGRGKDAGQTFGFLSIQFRTFSDVEAQQVEGEDEICALCSAAEEIQFLLHQASKSK